MPSWTDTSCVDKTLLLKQLREVVAAAASTMYKWGTEDACVTKVPSPTLQKLQRKERNGLKQEAYP